MKVLAILLLCLLFVGCGRGSAPAYDGRRGEAILDVCEAVVNDRDADAQNAIARLNDFSGADDFAVSVSLALQRKLNFAKADELLQQSDFQGLKAFIASCRASGSAGTELDGFDSVPDALEALSLFRRRMPWEESRVLKDALEDLEPHRALLSKSPEFVKFYDEQLATLKKLKASEAARQADLFIEQLERAAVAGDRRRIFELSNEFRRSQPDHCYFLMEKSLLAGALPLIPKGNIRAFAVAAAANYRNLPTKLRNQCAFKCAAAQQSGICGKLLNTLKSESLDKYESFFSTARDEGYTVSADLVSAYMRLLGIKPSQDSSPCVGIFEIGEVLKR
ncbi:MAG: hypothetical protein J5833_09330 [Victivallales bacterium]|nr:hypothetical protein [Victivallales bacterium]